MKTLLSTFAASLLVFSLSAHAHDPEEHAHSAPATKAKPTTCAQLADTQRYSNDLSDPDIKALNARCDAEKKPAEKAPTQKK